MASKSKLENTLRAAALGGLALAAGAVGEAQAQRGPTGDYVIRHSFVVRDANGNLTRDLVTGRNYTLEVRAEKPFAGSKPTSGTDVSFTYPEGIEFSTLIQKDLDYGTNDFFNGFQMFGTAYNSTAIGPKQRFGQICRYTQGITTTGEGPGEFATGTLAMYDFAVTGKPGATNATSGVFKITDSLTYEGTVQDGKIQPRKQRSLLVALIPECATNTSKLFYDFSDGQNPANNGKAVFSPYAYAAGKRATLEKSLALGEREEWLPLHTNSSDLESFEFTDESSRNSKSGFYRLQCQE